MSDVITKNDGKIVRADHMGTRRMAYNINGLTQGYYASFIFEGDTKILPLLDRHYKLNEPYIRNLTVRFEGDPDQLSKDIDMFSRPSQDSNRDDSDDNDRPRRGPMRNDSRMSFRSKDSDRRDNYDSDKVKEDSGSETKSGHDESEL